MYNHKSFVDLYLLLIIAILSSTERCSRFAIANVFFEEFKLYMLAVNFK